MFATNSAVVIFDWIF